MPETKQQEVQRLAADLIATARTKRGPARAHAFALLLETFDRIERRQRMTALHAKADGLLAEIDVRQRQLAARGRGNGAGKAQDGRLQEGRGFL